MAKGLSHFFEFKSRGYAGVDGDRYRVEFYVEGFSGIAEELTAGADPVVHTYNKGVGDGLLGDIVPSTIQIQAVSSSNFYASYFLSEKYGDVIVNVRKWNGSFWELEISHIVTPFESADFDRETGLYTVTISAECGLSYLRNVPYLPDSSSADTKVRLLGVLKKCVDSIPLASNALVDLPTFRIYDGTKLYDKDGEFLSPGPRQWGYWEAFVREANFDGMSCYDVISAIKQPYSDFFYAQNSWCVRNISDYGNYTVSVNLVVVSNDLGSTNLSTEDRTGIPVQRIAGGEFGHQFTDKLITINKEESKPRDMYGQAEFGDLNNWIYYNSFVKYFGLGAIQSLVNFVEPLPGFSLSNTFEVINGYLINKRYVNSNKSTLFQPLTEAGPTARYIDYLGTLQCRLISPPLYWNPYRRINPDESGSYLPTDGLKIAIRAVFGANVSSLNIGVVVIGPMQDESPFTQAMGQDGNYLITSQENIPWEDPTISIDVKRFMMNIEIPRPQNPTEDIIYITIPPPKTPVQSEKYGLFKQKDRLDWERVDGLYWNDQTTLADDVLSASPVYQLRVIVHPAVVVAHETPSGAVSSDDDRLLIDYIRVYLDSSNSEVSDGYSHSFVPLNDQIPERSGNTTVDLKIGFPSEEGTDALFMEDEMVYFYSNPGPPLNPFYTPKPPDEHIATNYLGVMGTSRLKTYSGSFIGNLSFWDLARIDSTAYRAANFSRNLKTNVCSVFLVENGFVPTLVTSPTYMSIYDKDRLPINRTPGRSRDRIFVSGRNVFFEPSRLYSGADSYGGTYYLSANPVYDSVGSDLYALSASPPGGGGGGETEQPGGTIVDIAEPTLDNWTLIRPAENGTYATREWSRKNLWTVSGNESEEASLIFGTLTETNIDIYSHGSVFGRITNSTYIFGDVSLVTDMGQTLTVVGSIRQTGVLNTLVKADSFGAIVAATASDLPTHTHLWAQITDKPNGGNYIWNQISSVQPGSSFWVSGTSRIGGNLHIGYGTAVTADIHLGVNRSVDGASQIILYSNAAASTTVSAFIRRAEGVNGRLYINQTGTGNIDLYTQHASHIRLGTTDTERARITAGGNFLIGSSTDTGLARLQVIGSIQQTNFTNALAKVNANGVFVAATASDITSLVSGSYVTTNTSQGSDILTGTKHWGNWHRFTVGDSVTAADWISLRPSDYGVGKPQLILKKDSIATTWSIQIWDGVNNSGRVNIAASEFTVRNYEVFHTNNFPTLKPDLEAIELLSGTTGLLRKTAANTWTLDTNTYLTSADISGLALNSRQIIAGNGLTGGGDLSADRTLTLGTPGSITLASTNSVSSTSHTHAFAPGGTSAQYIRGDGVLATMPTIPAAQTLSLTGTPGQIAISGGNSVALSSLVGINHPDFETNLLGIGAHLIFNTTGSTNYPSAGGIGILFQRENTTANGRFAIWKNSGAAADLYYNAGNNGWEIFASRSWVNVNAIQNQQLSAQSAGYWITGSGLVGGVIRAGYKTAGGASLQVGYDRVGAGVASLYLYSDLDNPTTLTAYIERGAGANAALNIIQNGTGLVLFRNGGGDFVFQHTTTDRYRIFSATGNHRFGGGADSTYAVLQVAGSVQITAVTGQMLKTDANGVIVAATAGTDYLTSASISGSFVTTNTPQTSGLTGDKTWSGSHRFTNPTRFGSGSGLQIISNGQWITPESSDWRSSGLYGVYDVARLGHIWAIGTGYRIAEDGSGLGGHYGLAYGHSTNVNVPQSGHNILFTNNGVVSAAVSMTTGTVWTTAHQTSAHWKAGYDCSPISLAFSTSTGLLTVNRQAVSALTINLDGRYLLNITSRFAYDLDTQYTSGVFAAGATVTNHPPGAYTYSPFMVLQSASDRFVQLWFDSYGGNSIYWRNGSNTVWGSWTKLVNASGTTAQYIRGDGSLASFPSISGGTVTSFSAGTLSPLFTTSVATETTTPALTFSLSNAAAYTVFGRASGIGAPSYLALTADHIPGLPASKITSGTIAPARLGSGTASGSTFLAGDSTWKSIPGGALTSTYIGFGNGSNQLSGISGFTFLSNRYINIDTGSGSVAFGMVSSSVNAFFQAVSGNLLLQTGEFYRTIVESGIFRVSGLSGGSTRFVQVDTNGDFVATLTNVTATLTNKYIGYGSVSNQLNGTSGFTFEESRYIRIVSGGGSFATGAASSDAFVQSVNANLLLQAHSSYRVIVDSGGFRVNSLAGVGTRMVIVDSSGNFGSQTISGGALTDTYIAYGSPSNLITGSSDFRFREGRYINIVNGSIGLATGVHSGLGIGFLESTGGPLWIQAGSGSIVAKSNLAIEPLGGSGTRMLTVDNSGNVGAQAIPGGGGSLPSGEIAYGTGSGITSSSNFTYTGSAARVGPSSQYAELAYGSTGIWSGSFNNAFEMYSSMNPGGGVSRTSLSVRPSGNAGQSIYFEVDMQTLNPASTVSVGDRVIFECTYKSGGIMTFKLVKI